MVDTERRHERGAALLLAVLMLAIMGVVGLASMDTTMRDRQIAGFQKRAQTAFYAAEAGVSLGLALLRADAQALAEGGEGALVDYDPSGETPPRFPDQSAPTFLGTDFPLPGSPSFFLDPDASDPDNPSAPPKAIRYVGKGGTCPGWVMTGNQRPTSRALRAPGILGGVPCSERNSTAGPAWITSS